MSKKHEIAEERSKWLEVPVKRVTVDTEMWERIRGETNDYVRCIPQILEDIGEYQDCWQVVGMDMAIPMEVYTLYDGGISIIEIMLVEDRNEVS